jgi:hypothetical protein
MQKTTLLTVSLLFLGTLPAMAQLGNIWSTDFQNYATDLQNYLKNNIAENSKPADYEAQTAIYNSTGQLNLPNPVSAAKNVRDDVIQKSISGTFENNPSLEATAASNEVYREITRGSAEGVLGTNGQIRLKAKLENIDSSIRDITQSIQQAQQNNNLLAQALQTTLETACQTVAGSNPTSTATGANSSCTALNNANTQLQILRVQGEQVKILAETFAQTMQVNHSLQYSNLNLANVSQQMEEANRARRVDTSAEAARLLRATSQIDLLGRENQNE